MAIELTAERLRELFLYDSDTGIFTVRKSRKGAKTPVGSAAGTLSPEGYFVIRINRRLYKAHRLAWLYEFGAWPAKDIDHANNCRSDNRIVNLREATESQNLANSKLPKNNTSGFKGVYPLNGRWAARIGFKGDDHFLGVFDTPEAASAGYYEAARQLFGEFARIA